MARPEKFTAKSHTFGKAPARIDLFGDKGRRAEPAQHIISFPGGAIELSRCTDGSYWAHIIVNRQNGDGDGEGLTSATGEVVGSRLDCDAGVLDLPHADNLTQVAVRIRPLRDGAR